MPKKFKPIQKIREIVDTLAGLSADIKELESQKSDLDTLLKKYVETKELDNDMDCIILGEDFQVEVGIAGSKREIVDLAKVRKILGDKAFMGIASVKLKDIDQYLSEEQQNQVINTTRTATRVYKFKPAELKSNLKKKTVKR